MNKKQAVSIILVTMFFISLFTSGSESYAASTGWQQDDKGYWYVNEDGRTLVSV